MFTGGNSAVHAVRLKICKDASLAHRLGLSAGLQTTPVAGLYVLFLKGQGHQGVFLLSKGHLLENCKFLLEYFKGTKAMTRGH